MTVNQVLSVILTQQQEDMDEVHFVKNSMSRINVQLPSCSLEKKKEKAFEISTVKMMYISEVPVILRSRFYFRGYKTETNWIS